MKIILQNGTPLGLVEDTYDTTILYPSCEVIFVADNTDIRSNQDPRLTMSLEELRACHLQTVKMKTFYFIDKMMPSWRQFRWSQYMTIYEKLINGGSLNPLEQAVYEGFPDTNETNESCYIDCLTAFGWMMQCIGECNRCEREINLATTLEEMKSISLAFPIWPLT